MLLFWNVSPSYLPMSKKFILPVNIQSRKLSSCLRYIHGIIMESFEFICVSKQLANWRCWQPLGAVLGRLVPDRVVAAARLLPRHSCCQVGQSKTRRAFSLGSCQIGSLGLLCQSGLVQFCQRNQT